MKNLSFGSLHFWLPSLLIHLALVGGLFIVLVLFPKPAVQKRVSTVRVIEKPPEVLAVETPKALDIRKPQKPDVQKEKVPPSFGINRDTLTSNTGSGVQVKAGNTLAKEVDQNPSQDALPIAVEEFLVSRMPKIKKEVRAPYPEEARIKRIEGPVAMDLLIDEMGRVRSVQTLSSPGFGLGEAAEKAILFFEFEPAQVDGKAVAVKIRYTYRFVLTQ